MPVNPESLSPQLRRVFESDCATGVEDFLSAATPDDRDAIVAVLASPQDQTFGRVQTAIHLAGRLGETRTAQAIAALLPDLDERGRMNAVTALGAIGGPDAENAILRAGQDPSPDVRRLAVPAL